MKKKLSILCSAILIILLLASLYNFINLKVLKRDLSSINGYAVLEVVSNSMDPTIKIGDLIIINTKDKNYAEKDIVTFYDDEKNFVTHRIVKITEKSVVTKGDANDTTDKEFLKDKIVGKYVLKISGIGKVFEFLKKPLVILIIFTISITICYIISMDKGTDLSLKEKEKQEFKEYLDDKEKFIFKTKQKITNKLRNQKNKKRKKKRKQKRKVRKKK